MINILPLYGILAISRLVFQVGTSVVERKKKHKPLRLPKAALVVPVYNEEISLLEPAFKSFAEQNYPDLQVIVVDDGSANSDDVRELSQRHGFIYKYQNNAGKRKAMYTAFSLMDPQVKVVLTADSDTLWHENAAGHLVNTLLQDDETGAVTGEVSVDNYDENWLTRLIAIRYYLAFVHERASQSFFGTVTCVSGPLGAYRREVIEKIKDKFISQKFMGKECTYGDDRHLTNLVLNEGYKVRFAARATAWTNTPARLLDLVKQQIRWSKSYWREIFWQARVLPKHGPYLVYDWLITILLPFALVVSAMSHFFNNANDLDGSLLLLVQTLLVMSIIRVLEPLVRTREPVFLMFLSYSFVYFALMLPVKFYALATLHDAKWGTR